MEPLTLIALGAGTGLLQTHMQNKAQAEADKRNAHQAAAQTQFSPYTRMGAGSFQAQAQKPMIGGAMQGAVTGLQLSQNYNKAQSDQAMMDRQTMGLDRGQQQQFVNGLGNQLNPYVLNYKNSYSNMG